MGELRRNRELPSLASRVLAAAVPEPLVTSRTWCSAVKRRSQHAGSLQLRQPCELAPRNRFPSAASFSGAVRAPPGHKPVPPAVGEPALAGGWAGRSPEAPPKRSHSVPSVLSPCPTGLSWSPQGAPALLLEPKRQGNTQLVQNTLNPNTCVAPSVTTSCAIKKPF